MIKAFKTEINPTPEQKKLIHQSIGVCRFMYNFYLAHNKEIYEKDGIFVSANAFSKWLNNEYLPNTPDKLWIKEVSTKAVMKSIINAETAFKRFFKGLSKYPNFKKKHKSDVKVYFVKVNQNNIICCERHRIKLPKLGWVKLKEKGYIPQNKKGLLIKSGTISYKAGRYYVSVLVDIPENRNEISKIPYSDGIGIDLGIKDLAIISNGKIYKNINKTKKIKKLEKKKRRLERAMVRKLKNFKSYKSNNKINDKKNKNLRKNQRENQIQLELFNQSNNKLSNNSNNNLNCNLNNKDLNNNNSIKDDNKNTKIENREKIKNAKNLQKNILNLQKIHQKITNIRKDYENKIINQVVKTKPLFITMEHLNIKGLMKNRHLAKAIAEQRWYSFLTKLQSKCELYGIELRQVDRFYPSSKLCNNCQNIKKDLKLKDRIYKCSCGYENDRDLNASLNLRDAKDYTTLTQFQFI